MDWRSFSRNSGLMLAAKLTVSSGPGNVIASCSSAVLVCPGASAGGPAGPQSQAGGLCQPARDVQSR